MICFACSLIRGEEPEVCGCALPDTSGLKGEIKREKEWDKESGEEEEEEAGEGHGAIVEANQLSSGFSFFSSLPSARFLEGSGCC